MTVKELKDMLNNEDDDKEVTVCVTTSENTVIWKPLRSIWHTANDDIVILGEY